MAIITTVSPSGSDICDIDDTNVPVFLVLPDSIELVDSPKASEWLYVAETQSDPDLQAAIRWKTFAAADDLGNKGKRVELRTDVPMRVIKTDDVTDTIVLNKIVKPFAVTYIIFPDVLDPTDANINQLMKVHIGAMRTTQTGTQGVSIWRRVMKRFAPGW